MKKAIVLLLFFAGNLVFAQRPSFLKKDSIQSTLDKNIQVFYYDKSTASKAKPSSTKGEILSAITTFRKRPVRIRLKPSPIKDH